MAEMEDRVRSLEDTRKALLQLIGADDESAVSGGAGAQGASDGTGGTGQPYTVVDPDSLLSEAEATEIKGILRLPPLRGPRTRGFGRIGSGGFFHTGVDVAGDVGTEIASPGDGVATFIGTDDTLGEVLVINHDPEIETVYGHNSSILVKVGDGVTAGQSIALLGNTGRSSAPHLHFEVHWRGKAIDPETVYPSYWQ
jgi:murein DD-endopeptidase MepM/ murein hydrolase activator NlpD